MENRAVTESIVSDIGLLPQSSKRSDAGSRTPRVSIGVPVYNGEPFLKQALESLLAQTFTDFEVIISDNASTDSTPEICQEFAARDRRVRYHRNARNTGMIANFRNVLELATGDFFMWACADDIRPPDAVKTLVAAFLNNPQAVMTHGPIILKIGDQSIEISNQMDLSHARPAKRVRVFTSKLQHNGMVCGLHSRVELMRAVKAVLANHYGPEYLLCLQMCLLGQIDYVPVPMLIYNHKESAATHDPMYSDLPVTMKTLREIVRPQGIRARKCRRVLVRGCYDLMRSPSTPLRDRILGSAAYVWAFSWRFRVKLAKEAVGLLASPVFWPGKLLRRGMRNLLNFT